MKYKVIRYFTDLQDNNFAYNAGDAFPREGKNVSQERVEELLSSNNKQGRPLIEAVKGESVLLSDDFSQHMNTPTTTGYDYSKNDIMRMPKNELRELGSKLGIEDAENLTGGALKPLIINALKL